MNLTANELIEQLNLRPLPGEGGFFVETYRASKSIPSDVLVPDYRGARPFATAIYFLLTSETFSAMHRLPGDEIYHFYLGEPVEMLQLKSDGTGQRIIIGNDLKRGMCPQVVAPGGVWQGSKLLDGGQAALLGTTTAPGFDFADYTPGFREPLTREYPAFRQLIECLCRE
jgi:predicted cupin superfamily sugar epimerase